MAKRKATSKTSSAKSKTAKTSISAKKAAKSARSKPQRSANSTKATTMPTSQNAIKEVLELESPTLQQLMECQHQIQAAETYDRVKPDLRDAERSDYDTAWLKKSLQAAVTLEFATIPPYLCSLWSIKNDVHDIAKSIREIVQEEMLHMALACNMLASLGETPKISTAVPTYPGGLPGGVHEGLIVGLSGLTKAALAGFLWIERPIQQIPTENPYQDGEFDLKKLDKQHPQDETIGAFYEQIQDGFERYLTVGRDAKSAEKYLASHDHDPRLTLDKQVSGPLAWAVIRNFDNVKYAIKLIQHQGEGSANTPEDNKDDLSHYYRFLEVYNGRKYKWNGKTLEDAGKLEWSLEKDVWPMASVPAGGYKQNEVSEEVWYYLDEFDNTYTKLLDQLQGAWTIGGQASLIHAYETMFDLEKYARPLMQIRTPYGGGETYGPCFRYKGGQTSTENSDRVSRSETAGIS